MFRSSLQRHVRVGNQARQLSAFASRQLRSQPLIASHQAWPQPGVRLQSLRQVALRFYSEGSAAASPQIETRESSSPPETVTKFADLTRLGVNQAIVQAITDDMGYETMTEVQSKTINPALKGTDLVAQAKTGTGKTLGFLVPVFQRILEVNPELADRRLRRNASADDIRAIIMSPTRELAEQIGVEAKRLAQHTGIVVQTAVGGTRKRESLYKMQREGCTILVATPGRLQDLLTDPESGIAAPDLEAFVLDEADRMLDVGFADDIRDILELLPPSSKVNRQTLLYSATIPRDVVSLAKSMVNTKNFEFVQTIDPNATPTHESVPQHLVAVTGYENLLPSVMEIADQAIAKARQDSSALPFKAILFFSNTATVQFANKVLKRTRLADEIPIGEIHSKLSQFERTRSAESFRRAQTGLLISSDVTARGMDFPNVSHVIQVGLPPDRDQYIHRVGRTGRAGNPGQGWLLLAQDEISEARERLPGLPIKPNNSITAAKFQLGQDENVPESFEEVSKAYARVPRSSFQSVYNAVLGQKLGRRIQIDDVVALLNAWCMNGLGWSQPPAIAPSSARKRGLDRVRGIRLGYDQEDDSAFDARSGFVGRDDDFSRGGGRNNSAPRGFGEDNSFSRGGGRSNSFSRGSGRDNGFSRGGRRDGGRFGGGRGGSGQFGNRHQASF
ncbi:DEAD-domain-containing protein [Hypoxylon sp. FL1284]|nr:DEAD-domain-containing protein [Hypoxylon sp. FL1284]